MDEAQPESGPANLPLELQALVDFLHVDTRPTAILHVAASTPRDDSVEYRAIYSNPSFRDLPSPPHELDDLRQALSRTLYPPYPLQSLHGALLDGKRWQVRVSGEYYIAVAAEGRRAAGRAEPIEQDKFGKQRVQVHVKGPGQTNGVGGEVATEEVQQSLDWTQHKTADASPWIKFMRSVDWASTGVGPMEFWEPTLRQRVLAITAHPHPRLIVFGEGMTFIYNEACVQLFGAKHPGCMGAHVSQPWSEIWTDLKPMLEAVYSGQSTQLSNLPFALERNGFLEETYWDSTLTPIFSPEGNGIGVFDELTETTLSVTDKRRRACVSSLCRLAKSCSTLQDLWAAVLQVIEGAEVDIPFALLYTVLDDLPNTGSEKTVGSRRVKSARLAGKVGIPQGHPDLITSFELSPNSSPPGLASACAQSWQSGGTVVVSTREGSLPAALGSAAPQRSFGDPVTTALVSPIKSTTADDIIGVLVTGLNPRCAFIDEYSLFMTLFSDLIEKTAALISLPEEQRRSQLIADDINNALAMQLKMTTLKAERSEAKFSRLASAAPTGMFMFDAEGRALYVNDTYLEMLDRTEKDHNARRPDTLSWQDDIHEDDLERFVATWKRVTEEKVPVTIEYRLKKPWRSIDRALGHEIEGETWLLATAFPEVEPDGKVTTVQGWLTDISHRKFSENLVAQRLEDALENKRQTENFIDMTSHEMRNPLSAMLQSADSIVSTLTSLGMPISDEGITLPAQTAEDIVDAAQTVILCAQHQKRIVDDVLTLSKLDASLLVISPDKVQVPTLITKALKMYEAEIERAGIEAQLCIEPSYEELGVDWVVLDPSRLLQVIINLLTNSIKFTQYSDVRKVKVFLGASHQKPTGQHHGISFVPPRRNRASRKSRRDQSRGDEIYLQIAVYDTGKGLSDEEMKSLFQRFQQASPKTYGQYGGSGLGLFISRELCELQGGQIGVASSEGRTIFTFFVTARKWLSEEDERTRKPSIVSGSRFTSASNSPVAFSRRGSVQMQELTNQMTHEKAEDGSTVEEFHPLTRNPSNAKTQKPLEKISEKPKAKASVEQELHVLIVEDNLINQKVLSQQLRRAGCTVYVANHGVECLEFLEKSHFCTAETPLSLILLDLEMPTMDGLTCIRHIRERQASGRITGHVPVIAVTANARSEQISEAIEAGMDQVVTKPFRIPELVPQMETLVAEVAAHAVVNAT
ncbi:Transcription factor SKN7 [Lecanosticta acicola]|uniref:Transcription factor SKN7 n=1 Tax=Lecanosticta acicola TaxID=111012 RepID=A0AAI9EAD1_9PEZI|nr:Transcription factor SKN7 [Lecanosticta acicola]